MQPALDPSIHRGTVLNEQTLLAAAPFAATASSSSSPSSSADASATTASASHAPAPPPLHRPSSLAVGNSGLGPLQGEAAGGGGGAAGAGVGGGGEAAAEGPVAPPPTPVSSAMPARPRSKANILDSLLEISLDTPGGAAAVGGGGEGAPAVAVPSAARTMMELKAIEKMRNEMNAFAPVPSRKAGNAPGSGSTSTTTNNNKNRSATNPFLPFGASALEQATAGFGAEAEGLGAFERMQPSQQKKGRKAVLSTKARQRRDAGAEKEEAYAERLNGRVAKQSRRKERMERMRRMY